MALTMKPRALVAEFIGTFALLFVVFLVVTNFADNPVKLLAIALGVGLTIMIMGTSFGAISGGHFNPCVSFGLWVAKKIDFGTMVGYWIAQAVGGIAAVFLGAYISGADRTTVSVGWSGHSATQAVIAEAVAAFFFLISIFMTAVDSRAPKNGALYLGFTLTIGILAIGPISGGAINPAVGLALSVGSSNWDCLVSWLVGPLVGAGLAALVYTGLFEKQDA